MLSVVAANWMLPWLQSFWVKNPHSCQEQKHSEATKRSPEGLSSPLPLAGSWRKGLKIPSHKCFVTASLHIEGHSGVDLWNAFSCLSWWSISTSCPRMFSHHKIPLPFTSLLLQLYPVLVGSPTGEWPPFCKGVSFFFSLGEANPEFSNLRLQLYSQTLNRRFILTMLDIGSTQETK